MLSGLNELGVCAGLVLAQAGGSGGAGGPPQPEFWVQIANMLIVIAPFIIVFWVMVWRPDSKRRRERQETLNTLEEKDEVVTIGGLHGKIVKLDAEDVILQVDSKSDVKLRFRRSSIEAVTKKHKANKEGEKK
ncbi:MAG: preprotein translocase subunit YajC [Planctomycetota bacterium]|nr:preprotein translocase subunit YajC [Planctomycetota bacterium]